jgi:hypothetical protein
VATLDGEECGVVGMTLAPVVTGGIDPKNEELQAVAYKKKKQTNKQTNPRAQTTDCHCLGSHCI